MKTWTLSRLWLASLALAIAVIPSSPSAASRPDITGVIPYEEYTLDNGLRVLIHVNKSSPVVAVNVWYHVGARHEAQGRTGFAHLFEHLMFNGSENYDDEYFKPLELAGATDLNGTTNNDRTNYFQTIPKGALDLVLWMESDRMGHLLGAITQEKLDEQRGVVKNEKRQGENQPYGKVFFRLSETTFPAGHKYSWSTIGSMEDLDAAALEDVYTWFRDWYGPNNATIVLAGDVDPEVALAKVDHYFGSFKPSKQIPLQPVDIARRFGHTVDVMEDDVPRSRLYAVWNTPPYGSHAGVYQELLANILTGSEAALLSNALSRDNELVRVVQSFYYDRALAGQFIVLAEPLADVTLDQVRDELLAQLSAVAQDGIDADVLEAAKTSLAASFVRGLERNGGFGGKSDVLARNAVLAGDPGWYQTYYQILYDATPEDIQNFVAEWLMDGLHELRVVPASKEIESARTAVDRTQLPKPPSVPQVMLPSLEQASLKNGMKISLVRRTGLPLVEAALVFDGGHKSSPEEGIDSFTFNMLPDGTKKLSATELAKALEQLGASLDTSSNVDTNAISISSLTSAFPETLALLSDVARTPRFDGEGIERLRNITLGTIAQEKASPVSQALRLLPPLIYGEGHPYAVSRTGTGDPKVIESLSRSDLVSYHAKVARPDNAHLIVVGDITIETLTSLADRAFRKWKQPKAPLVKTSIPVAQQAHKKTILLVPDEGAIQSIIMAGTTIPQVRATSEAPLAIMNDVIGGTFTSRLNLNLREDKHWSYGARSLILNAKGDRPFLVYAPVQADRTGDSLREAIGEFTRYRTSHPASKAEIQKIVDFRVRGIAGRYETNGNLLGDVSNLIVHGRPMSHLERYPQRMTAVTQKTVRDLAKERLNPEDWVVVIVGDVETVRPQLNRFESDWTIRVLDEAK